MRMNLPVTGQEFDFQAGETLVSTTDLKGRITYCNPAFIRVSGYDEQELLGQPHNVIRHPGMPSEAFRDMWATIQSNQPWTAVVKNRRKNGDHYWVLANATPIVSHGKPVGYVSVRIKPTREQIRAADALYAQMREEASSKRIRTRLHNAQVIRPGLAGRLQRLGSFGVRGQLALALATVAGLSWLGGHTGIDGPTGVAVAFAVALAAATATWFWLTRVAVKPIDGAVSLANAIAAGDLTRRIEATRADEIGRVFRALNQLNVNLQAIVGDVRREAANIDVGSREIAQGNVDLSARTESQAAALEQTAASIEQVTSAAQNNHATAAEAHRMASRASAVAAEGGQAVQRVTATMSEINASAQRIAEIIGVIDSIAFQTNLLALNAAVEAARAGEQGRGFAVVATEVRSLSQRTAAAAREIKALIGESVDKAQQGATVVEEAGRTIGQVVAAVRQVNQLISDITHASSEQSSGIAQINIAVSQLDSTTQQNAGMVEQVAAATHSLNAQSKALNASVSVFTV